MSTEKKWYEVDNADAFDSPMLLFYSERMKENIRRLTDRVETIRLRPHVKTNKTAEVTAMMLSAGITKFKAATIAEAEMLAMIHAPDVLLAYPPTSVKIKRLIQLIKKYPGTKFSCLVDHADTVAALDNLFSLENLISDVFIDLNIGMNRTGIVTGQALGLFEKISTRSSLHLLGIHAYDGHIKERDLTLRTDLCQKAFAPVLDLKNEMEKLSGRSLILIAGGSPTTFIHASAGARECSPGTFVFWDKGYSDNLPEQPFEWAALIACRVISIPTPGKVCVDLGYKSVASENALPRVYFLNAPDAIPFAHSEEHLVLSVPDSAIYKSGDLLYGVPYHICPTVALYDKACVVKNHRITDSWNVIARQRSITV